MSLAQVTRQLSRGGATEELAHGKRIDRSVDTVWRTVLGRCSKAYGSMNSNLKRWTRCSRASERSSNLVSATSLGNICKEEIEDKPEKKAIVNGGREAVMMASKSVARAGIDVPERSRSLGLQHGALSCVGENGKADIGGQTQ